MRVFIEGVGLLGPGLGGWQRGRKVLARREPYEYAPTAVKASELLPAAERRRAGVPVNLALAVGREAFLSAGHDPAATVAVFTSSSGDGEILHRMCETLATAEREISPTSFLNSVHNVAAGYWSIATKCQEASTSLCVHDASFAAGLLETAAQASAEQRAVALIAYDGPYPEPLHAARSIHDKFAMALLITPIAGERACAMMELRFVPSPGRETRMQDGRLETLRTGNPAARSLPLLAALAGGKPGEVVLPYLQDSHLAIRVVP
ncbi:MAG TPA: beta-ketoacyl synthase chain length factor [Burkholderiales bacterium]|nr:beta-ketoacyl synthase chain length factor [Burkholderiales bacterium]